MSTYEELLVELGDYGSPFAESPPIVQLITLVMFNTAMFVAVHDPDINPFFFVLVGEPSGGYMGHSVHTCVGAPRLPIATRLICVILSQVKNKPQKHFTHQSTHPHPHPHQHHTGTGLDVQVWYQ